jgi:hypothetical protein
MSDHVNNCVDINQRFCEMFADAGGESGDILAGQKWAITSIVNSILDMGYEIDEALKMLKEATEEVSAFIVEINASGQDDLIRSVLALGKSLGGISLVVDNTKGKEPSK